MTSIIRDERGTMEIPMRFIVYVIITGVVVALAAMGISRIEPGITSDTLEKQIGAMKVSLAGMQSGAARNLIDPFSPGGNIRTYRIVLPEDVTYLAFGVDPDPDNNGNLSDSEEGVLTERGNFIIYRSGAGKKKIPLEENIELREGAFEDGRWIMNRAGGKEYGVVLRGNGRSEITFELVYDPISKERYTLAYFTDDLDAVINPYDPSILANSLRVWVDPNWILADGVTSAQVIVQLIDAKGRDVSSDDVKINLTVSGGILGMENLATVNGRARTNITSDLVGTAIISAGSPGLNPGSTYLTVKQVPVVLNFGKWLYAEDEKLTANFITDQSLEYGVYFKGNGTDLSIPFIGTWWPSARIYIDGNLTGEELIDNEMIREKAFPRTTLAAGMHVLTVKLKNDIFIPPAGDTNLFVESVTLSE